jgi:hypothetical protein
VVVGRRRNPAPRWTARRLDAAINAVKAMLATEEGEGDWDPAHTADDLEAALARLRWERTRFPAK